MKVPGEHQTLLGVTPAHERLEAAHVIAGELEEGLVVELELACRQRLAQVALQRAAHLHLRVHLVLEEAVGAAAVGLGAVECEIGVADELVGRRSVERAHGDADAGADHHLMPLDHVGSADDLDDAMCQRRGIGGLRDGRLDDGELVAAHARDRVRLAQQRPQPVGHDLEQLVAGRMAQAVVDGLEVVEIEQVHGHDLAAPHAPQRILEPFVEQHAVGQAGQRVVQGHMGDLGLRATLLGDVVMGGHGAAAGHRLGGHGDVAAIAQLVDILGRSLPGDALHSLAHELIGILVVEFAVGDALLDDLAQRRAGLHLLGRQTIHFGIAPVADDETIVTVVHGQALQHVVQGRIELQILAGQPLFLLLQARILLFEAGLQALPLRDVLVGDDATTVGGTPPQHADDASVGQLLGARGDLAEFTHPAADEALLVLDMVVAALQAIVEDLPQRCAGLHLLGRQPVHLGIAAVADDQPLLGIIHRQTLGHVFHGQVELLVARVELVLALLQKGVLPGELGVELGPLGDVLVRAEQPAARHRPAHHRDVAPVAQLEHFRRAAREPRNAFTDELLRVEMAMGADGGACLENLPQAGAWPHLLAGEPVELGVAPVSEHDPVLSIIEAHALRHVADGGIEARVLRGQLLLALLQERVLRLQPRVEELALGQVVQRNHPAAVGSRVDRNG